MMQSWQCFYLLLNVDTVLTSVDSVDVNWKNSHVFVRAVLTVLLVLTVLTLQTKRDRFWDKWSCIDKSLMTVLLHVATCWCCVDWCWQMLIAIGLWKVLIILERTFRRKWRLSIQREPNIYKRAKIFLSMFTFKRRFFVTSYICPFFLGLLLVSCKPPT